MCYNKELSLTLFILGAVSGLNLIGRFSGIDGRQVQRGIFIFSVSLIQLVDYFLWLTIKNGKIIHPEANIIVGNLIGSVLFIQVLLMVLGATFLPSVREQCPDKNRCDDIYWVLVGLLITLAVCAIILIVSRRLGNWNVKTLPDSASCRLNWGSFNTAWTHSNFTRIVLFICIAAYSSAQILSLYQMDDFVMFIISVITLFLSIVYTSYNTKWNSLKSLINNFKPGVLGSWWCWSTVCVLIFSVVMDLHYRFPDSDAK